MKYVEMFHRNGEVKRKSALCLWMSLFDLYKYQLFKFATVDQRNKNYHLHFRAHYWMFSEPKNYQLWFMFLGCVIYCQFIIEGAGRRAMKPLTSP